VGESNVALSDLEAMPTMNKVTQQTRDQLRSHVGELPTVRKIRPYDIVMTITDELEQARKRGYSLDDLVEILRSEGVTITRNTLRNYISRARSVSRKAATTASSERTVGSSKAEGPKPSRRSNTEDERGRRKPVVARMTPDSCGATRSRAPRIVTRKP
jgi:hypothetical protein